MIQNEQMKQQLLDILYQGLEDEMNAAYQYTALAGKHGNAEIKQAFLHYAQDELRHAEKLLFMIGDMQDTVQQIPLIEEDQEDLYLFLIEYMAKEESSIFYYEALENLVQQPELQLLCREIRGEEQLHLNQMRTLYQQVKEAEKA